MKNNLLKMRTFLVIGVLVMITILIGCSSDKAGTEDVNDKEKSEDSDSEVVELTEATHVLNWFAQPAHGGQYAALQQGFYEDHGLDISIEQGGPQVSATQIVASGNAEFGVAQADEILMAIEEGLPLVVVAAAFQDTQQAFAFHKGQPIEDIEDFNGREVFVTPGAGYWDFLKAKYDLSDVKEVAHTGSLLNFIADEESVAQVFAASEPFALEEEGIETDLLYLKDTGYSLYSNVVFTTQKVLDEKPEAVEGFVKATIEGWNYYDENMDTVNGFLKEINPDMDVDLMAKEAEAQKQFMYSGDGETYGVGYMKEENWQKIKDILLDIGLIKTDIDLDTVFTTEFLPY